MLKGMIVIDLFYLSRFGMNGKKILGIGIVERSDLLLIDLFYLSHIEMIRNRNEWKEWLGVGMTEGND